MRPPSSVRSAIRIPAPGAPSRSAGVPSNARSAVEEEFRPIFSSSRVTAKPSAPARTTNALIASSFAGEDEERGGVRAVRDPLLAAGDAAVGGARAQRARVRARARPRSARTPRSPRPPRARARDCSPPCVEQRQRARARVHGDGHADAGVGARELLQHEHVGEEVRARAAVLLRARRRPSARARRARRTARAGTCARGPSRRRAARSARRRSAPRGRGSRAAPG